MRQAGRHFGHLGEISTVLGENRGHFTGFEYLFELLR